MKKMNVFLTAMLVVGSPLMCNSVIKDMALGAGVGIFARGASYTVQKKAGANNGQAMLVGGIAMAAASLAAASNFKYQNADWTNQFLTALTVCLASMYVWAPLGNQEHIAQAQVQPAIQPVIQPTQSVQPIKTH